MGARRVLTRCGAGLLAVLPVALGACGTSGGPVGVPTDGAPTTGAEGPGYMVRAAPVNGLGSVLVDGYGLTLYLFEPDRHGGKSTCTSYCASRWPPLTLPTGVVTPVVGTGVEGALVATTRRSDGTLQVTYDGWPLYHWIGDTASGQDNGQALRDSGGLWYAVDGAGQPVVR